MNGRTFLSPSPKGGAKTRSNRFVYKSGFFWYKVFCAKTFSGKVVRHLLAYLTVQRRAQMLRGRRPLLPEILGPN